MFWMRVGLFKNEKEGQCSTAKAGTEEDQVELGYPQSSSTKQGPRGGGKGETHISLSS